MPWYHGGMEFETKIRSGLHEVVQQLSELRQPGGHWIGELSSSALSTATAITAIQFYMDATGETDAELQQQIQAGIQWLIGQQKSDGGFGDTPLSHSNISTTMFCLLYTSPSPRDS